MLSGKQKAEEAAIAQAAGQLTGVNLVERCRTLGLPLPESDHTIRLLVFGSELILRPPEFRPAPAANGKPVKNLDLILALHYLLSSRPVQATGEFITFREFPGGQFYWEPFRSRSILPLLKRIGNDLDRLRRNLDRFPWQPYPAGDLGARIHAVGKLDVVLIYHAGDDEFPPAAEFLFDAGTRRVYGAEDAAAIASRICCGLL